MRPKSRLTILKNATVLAERSGELASLMANDAEIGSTAGIMDEMTDRYKKIKRVYDGLNAVFEATIDDLVSTPVPYKLFVRCDKCRATTMLKITTKCVPKPYLDNWHCTNKTCRGCVGKSMKIEPIMGGEA